MYNLFFNSIKFNILLILLLSAETNSCAQTTDQKQKPATQLQGTTPDQTLLIKKILSGYNAAKLKAADAKAIHEKFREAGIDAGPENDAAIKAAGFDPDQLKRLAPLPNTDRNSKSGPPTLEERLKAVKEKICKPLLLLAAQEETVIKAFGDYYTEMDRLTNVRADHPAPPDKSKTDLLEKETRPARPEAVEGTQKEKKK